MREVSANRHGTARCVAKLCRRCEISDSKQVSREEDIPEEEEEDL